MNQDRIVPVSWGISCRKTASVVISPSRKSVRNAAATRDSIGDVVKGVTHQE